MEAFLSFVVLTLAIWLLWGRRELQAKRAVRELQNIRGFTCNFFVIGTNGVAVGIDSARQYIAFVDSNRDSWVYSFQEIVAVEVCKNGITWTKTNRGRQLISVLVGQALFGEKGFIVGGDTASTRTSERIESLSLKVYVSDLNRPVREIVFYQGSPLELGSRRFRRYANAIDEWYGRIKAAIV